MAVACEPEVRAGAPSTGLANGGGPAGRAGGGAARTGCAVILALLATAGACGGGGEPVMPDASRDMAADMAITPDTGTPDSTGMPDKPAKPLGDPCATLNRVRLGPVRGGRLLQRGVQPRLLHLREPGHGGDLPAGVPGDRSRRPLPDRGGDDLRHHRRVRRHRRVRALQRQRRRRVRGRGLRRVHAHDDRDVRQRRAAARGRRRCPARRSSARPTARPAARRARRTPTAWRPTAASTGSCGKKPIGATCGNNDECNSTFCAQGRCCGTACTGTCRSCAVAGSEGTCRNVPDGQDLHGHCADDDRRHLRAGRDVQRHGRLPQVRGQHRVRHGFVQRRRRAGGGALRRRRDVRARDAALVQPVRVRDDELQDQLRDRRRLRDRLQLRRQRLRAAGERHAVHLGGDVQVGLLRAGGLLQRRLRRHLQGVQPHRVRRDLLADSRRDGADARHAVHRHGGDQPVRHRRSVQRRRRVPQLRGQHHLRRRELHRARRCRRRGPATAPASCRAATTSPCTPYTCGTGACRTTCTATTQCTTGNTCVNSSCGKIPIGGACPSGVNCRLRLRVLRQQRLLQQRLHGHVHVVLADGQRRDVLTDRARARRRWWPRSARRPRRRRAATTGPVTAPGRAASTSAAPSAPRRCARARRLPCRRARATAPGSARAATVEPVRKVHLRHHGGRLPDQLHDRRHRLRGAQHLQRQHLHAQADRRGVHDGRRVRLQLLRAGILLQPGVRHRRASRARSPAASGRAATSPTAPRPRPRRQCVATAATACGLDGMCNGAGACRFWASGTQCAAGTCVGSTLTPARTCDGAGVCRSVTSTLCDPYQCGSATACKTTCTSTAADCVSPNSCVSMSCGKLPERRGLHDGGECNSNFCAQGVCCSTACSGTCASCALTGSLGACSSVPAGQDPLNQCADQGVATCGTDGSCNGSGACRRYAAGTVCVAGDLHAASTLTPNATCNASGTCVTPATHLVRAVRVRNGRVQDHLHDDRRLQRRPLRLHRHDVHARRRT